MTTLPAEAIVLAGGAGTRLRDVLPGTPKVLAPVGGRPFLHRLLEALAVQGIERVVLATGVSAEAIESSAHAAGVPLEIVFSREAEPLGTGGAIARAFGQIRGDVAWVFNGDSYADVDLRAIASTCATAPGDAWLVATRVDDVSRFGALLLDETRVVRFMEKREHAGAGWINAGIYRLPRTLMPQGACSIETELFPAWASEGRLHAVKTDARFIDIGTPASLASAGAFFER